MRVVVGLVLLCAIAHGLVSTQDTSINSTLCFVERCGGNFTFLTGPLPVTVGGFYRSVTELSIVTGTTAATGEFWLFWPVCMARYSVSGDPIVVRPDLSFIMFNGAFASRTNALLAFPNCDIRPGFAYQRFSFTGTFEQELVFRSYPLDQHILLVQVSESTYNETQVRYELDDVPPSWQLTNVLQVSTHRLVCVIYG
jgi:hypothetical protein